MHTAQNEEADSEILVSFLCMSQVTTVVNDLLGIPSKLSPVIKHTHTCAHDGSMLCIRHCTLLLFSLLLKNLNAQLWMLFYFITWRAAFFIIMAFLCNYLKVTHWVLRHHARSGNTRVEDHKALALGSRTSRRGSHRRKWPLPRAQHCGELGGWEGGSKQEGVWLCSEGSQGAGRQGTWAASGKLSQLPHRPPPPDKESKYMSGKGNRKCQGLCGRTWHGVLRNWKRFVFWLESWGSCVLDKISGSQFFFFYHNLELRNTFYITTVCAKRKQNFMKQYPY